MKLKGLLLASEAMQSLVFGAGRIERLSLLVDLVDGREAMADNSSLSEVLGEAQIIVSTWGMLPLDADFLAKAPNLEAVFYAAGSVRGFVTDASWDRGIVVQSSWVANAVAVAEFTVAQIVLGLKNYWAQVRRCRETTAFGHGPVNGCFQKRVGIIGAGAIGGTVLSMLKSYELETVIYDPYVSDEGAAAMGARKVGLAEMFASCHCVTLHAPNIPETRHMLGSDHFRTMLPNSCFINTARGALVDEVGLAQVLREREDLTVLLDVTEPEPPAPDSALWSLPNVILSPHIAGSMGDECRRQADYSIAELERYIAGEPLMYRVTRAMMATMA